MVSPNFMGTRARSSSAPVHILPLRFALGKTDSTIQRRILQALQQAAGPADFERIQLLPSAQAEVSLKGQTAKLGPSTDFSHFCRRFLPARNFRYDCKTPPASCAASPVCGAIGQATGRLPQRKANYARFVRVL